nr:(Fe-S)-binding protein [Thermoanaerobacterium sp. RBIITD]
MFDNRKNKKRCGLPGCRALAEDIVKDTRMSTIAYLN